MRDATSRCVSLRSSDERIPRSLSLRPNASGAIAGLMAAYLMLFPRVRVYQALFFVRFIVPAAVYLTLWLLLQMVLGYLSLSGGAGAGVALNRGRFADGAELNRAAAVAP